MSQTLKQIFDANPVTSLASTDLLYVSQSPYTAGHDAGISGASLNGIFATKSQVQTQAFNAATATGLNDAFVVTLSPVPAALTDGLLITMDSGSLVNLTSSPTLKVNAFAAKPIVTFAGAPAPGDVQTGSEYIFVYNLANDHFQLINPSTSTADTFQVQSSGYSYALDTGIANAYIANILPAQLTTQSGLQIVMTAINANSAASTLTVNGVTHPILLSNGSALTGGEILLNGIYQFFYSSALTSYILVNPSISFTPSAAQSGYSFTGTMINPIFFVLFNVSFAGGDQPFQRNLIGAIPTSTVLVENNITDLNLGNINWIFSSNLTLSSTSVTSFESNNLIMVTSQINLTFPLVTSMSFPRMVSFNGIAGVMSGLTSLSLPLVEGCGGTFSLVANALTSLSFPALTNWGASPFAPTMNALTTLSFPVMVAYGAAFSQTLPALTTLTLTNLVIIAGAFAAIFATLTTLSLPALTTLGATWSTTMALVTTATFTSLQTVVGAVTASFAALTTLSFPAIVSFGAAVTFTAANMVTFSLGSTLKSVGGNWTMTGMKLNQASVDGILVSLAALDGTGGTTAYSSKTINLSGGTSSAPSATGLAAKAVLQARSCTVTTN